MARSILTTLFVTVLFACEAPQDEEPAERPPLRAVASVPAVAQWLHGLGGDLVEVTLLLPPGASPHLWQPTVTTISNVAEADLSVLVGGGLEPWAGQILRSTVEDRRDVVIVDWLIAQGLLSLDRARQTPDGDHVHVHGLDPHVWMNPALAQQICQMLSETLCELAPTHAEVLRLRAEAYQQRLGALSEECGAWSARFGPRRVVTFHRAWDHFAEALGLEVTAIIEPAPGVEPSGREMRRLIDQIRETEVDVIVAEAQFNPALARRLSEATGAPVAVLDPLGQEGQTYAELIRQNLTGLEQALAGQKGQAER